MEYLKLQNIDNLYLHSLKRHLLNNFLIQKIKIIYIKKLKWFLIIDPYCIYELMVDLIIFFVYRKKDFFPN